MRPGGKYLFALMFLSACSRPTGVRVQLALEDGAPTPEAVDVSVYDRYGVVVFGAELTKSLPGDLLILVSKDAEFVRVVGHGTSGGQLVVAGASVVQVAAGHESNMPLVLSGQMPADIDDDGVPDVIDDCPKDFDPEQVNTLGEGVGDACAGGLLPLQGTDLGQPASDLAKPKTGGADMAQPPVAQPDLAPVPPATCGDGVVQTGEACDDGAANSDDPQTAATCTSMCVKRAPCGSLAGSSGAQIDAATGHCYVAWPNLVTWASASRQCEARGGHLATITSASEDARVMTLSGATDHWIGLKIDHGQAARDHWVTGEPVSYVHYAPNEPNNGGTNSYTETCGSTKVLQSGWDDRPCGFASTGALPAGFDYSSGYVCENECGNGIVDPGEGCDGGAGCTNTCQKVRPCTEAGAVSSPINGHCYFALASAVTFADAMLACPTGTHLATLDEIAESASGALAVGATDAWIALKAATTQGSYAWTVGSDVFDPHRYHGFLGGEPNDSSGAPYCARITAVAGWKDHPCSDLYVPLCERE